MNAVTVWRHGDRPLALNLLKKQTRPSARNIRSIASGAPDAAPPQGRTAATAALYLSLSLSLFSFPPLIPQLVMFHTAAVRQSTYSSPKFVFRKCWWLKPPLIECWPADGFHLHLLPFRCRGSSTPSFILVLHLFRIIPNRSNSFIFNWACQCSSTTWRPIVVQFCNTASGAKSMQKQKIIKR